MAEARRNPSYKIKKQTVQKVSVQKPKAQKTTAQKPATQKFVAQNSKSNSKCPVSKKCGGCKYIDMAYTKQLDIKQKAVAELLKPFAKVEPIIGMKNPLYYRNKVTAAFDRDAKGNPISGIYEENSHKVIKTDSCFLEDERADAIIVTIRSLLKSFKIKTYDEDTGYGLLRHVMVRTGKATGEVMVILVVSSPIFPSKNNFVKVLRQKHPEISTIVLNINAENTSMVLGERNITIYGKGYIKDVLCGLTFTISPGSFYQVNPVQTEVLYKKAIEYAGLTGKETVLDAYCGIGTIGLIAASKAKEVLGVELNAQAVRDARGNARANGVKNVQFFAADAGAFMTKYAADGGKIDVLFMDPPRSGSTKEFIDAVAVSAPNRIVYISCNPETLATDLKLLTQKGYKVKKAVPVDMFPMTEHCEVVCCLVPTRG